MTVDFRALCTELVDKLYYHADEHSVDELITRVCAALYATQPPEPTDEEIAAAIRKGADQEFYATVEALAEYCDCGVELTDSGAREVLYELRRPHIVLDGWGNEKPFC